MFRCPNSPPALDRELRLYQLVASDELARTTRDNGLPIYRGTCEMEDEKEQHIVPSQFLKLAAVLTVEEP